MSYSVIDGLVVFSGD